MCLIAYERPHAKSVLKMESLETASRVNPHGWGIMYAKEGKLIIHKGFDDSWKKLWQAIPAECPRAIHFRYATGGKKNRDNCHPFLVTAGKKDGSQPALGLMHNGVLSSRIAAADANRSDTANYVLEFRGIIRRAPGILRNEMFRDMLGDYIGGGNKFLFMDSNGKIYFANEQRGKWLWGGKDVWVSNEYSFNETHRDKKDDKHPATQPYATGGYEGMYGNWNGFGSGYGGSYYNGARNRQEQPSQAALPYVGGDQATRQISNAPDNRTPAEKTADGIREANERFAASQRAANEAEAGGAMTEAERRAKIAADAEAAFKRDPQRPKLRQMGGWSEDDLAYAVEFCDAAVSQGGTLSFMSDEGFKRWKVYAKAQLDLIANDKADAEADRAAGITTPEQELAAIMQGNADAAAYLESIGVTDTDADTCSVDGGPLVTLDGVPVEDADGVEDLADTNANAVAEFERRFAAAKGKSATGQSARRFQERATEAGKEASEGRNAADRERSVYQDQIDALRGMSPADMLQFCRDEPDTAADLIEAFIAQYGYAPYGVYAETEGANFTH